MFMLLLGAFSVLLCRYTGQEDVVVGFPVAGRRTLETESLIGFFVNTLLMRNDLSGNPTFRELLGRVREQALNAYANPDVPFEKLVEHLRPERDLSRNPLFQVLFDVHRLRTTELHAAGVSFNLMNVDRRAAFCDQAWNITITDEGLCVRVEYNTDLFDETTVKRLMARYQRLLCSIVANPLVPISELDQAGHRQHLLIILNESVSNIGSILSKVSDITHSYFRIVVKWARDRRS